MEHVHNMDCHTNLICWLIAWGRIVKIAENEADRLRLVSTPRLDRAESHFRTAAHNHRAVCQGQDSLTCPVRMAGGPRHWAGIA